MKKFLGKMLTCFFLAILVPCFLVYMIANLFIVALFIPITYFYEDFCWWKTWAIWKDYFKTDCYDQLQPILYCYKHLKEN